jgi:hypothetical protein
MSGKQKSVDPVEAMKVLRNEPKREPVFEEPEVTVADDVAPGKLPDMPVTRTTTVYIVEEDKRVLVRGVPSLYRKGRELIASNYGPGIIETLLDQGLKMRTEEREI